MNDYKDLIVRLKLDCRNCKLWDGTGCRLDGDCSSHAKLEAAAAIEELSKLAEAIPHKCKCCIGCEIEQGNGGCGTDFVLSPERAKAFIEENLDWWRKFRGLMDVMGTPIPEPPKEDM